MSGIAVNEELMFELTSDYARKYNEIPNTSKQAVQWAYEQGRTKAIDEFAEKVKETLAKFEAYEKEQNELKVGDVKYEPMTNGDKIRSMTDEGLAEWLHNISHDSEAEEPIICIYDLDKEKEIELHDSYGDLLEWLKSEVEQKWKENRI